METWKPPLVNDHNVPGNEKRELFALAATQRKALPFAALVKQCKILPNYFFF